MTFTPFDFIVLILILLLSIIIHEIAHGYAALRMGDDTAEKMGRLTLNPIKHIDPVGSVIVPLILFILPSPFIFAWAKPVPVNPRKFRDKKYGQAKVAFSGPAANLLLALLFGLPLRFFSDFFSENPSLLFIFGIITLINLILAFFNLLPVPPLDGSHILFTFISERSKMFFLQYRFFLFILLLFFFLTPLFVFITIVFQIISGPSSAMEVLEMLRRV